MIVEGMPICPWCSSKVNTFGVYYLLRNVSQFGKFSLQGRAVDRAWFPQRQRDKSFLLDLLQAVLIQPNLSVLSAPKTVWSTSGRSHSSFVALSTVAVGATTAQNYEYVWRTCPPRAEHYFYSCVEGLESGEGGGGSLHSAG